VCADNLPTLSIRNIWLIISHNLKQSSNLVRPRHLVQEDAADLCKQFSGIRAEGVSSNLDVHNLRANCSQGLRMAKQCEL